MLEGRNSSYAFSSQIALLMLQSPHIRALAWLGKVRQREWFASSPTWHTTAKRRFPKRKKECNYWNENEGKQSCKKTAKVRYKLLTGYLNCNWKEPCSVALLSCQGEVQRTSASLWHPLLLSVSASKYHFLTAWIALCATNATSQHLALCFLWVHFLVYFLYLGLLHSQDGLCFFFTNF